MKTGAVSSISLEMVADTRSDSSILKDSNWITVIYWNSPRNRHTVYLWFIILFYLCNGKNGHITTMISNGRHSVSNHQHFNSLFNRSFKLTQKKHKSSTLLTLCERNPLVTSGFPSQRASYSEFFSMSWRHKMQSVPFDVFVLIMCCWQIFKLHVLRLLYKHSSNHDLLS